MKYIELSIKSLREISKSLAEKIEETFQPDVIFFIAKGGFIIGEEMSRYFSCPMEAIEASRKGTTLKKSIAPLLKFIPRKLRIYLREKELNSNIHRQISERNINLIFDKAKYEKVKNILVVDDSLDTGITANLVKQKLLMAYPEASIKIAAINIFEKSKTEICCDYYYYKDAMLNCPGSIDSKETQEFSGLYENFMKLIREKNNSE